MINENENTIVIIGAPAAGKTTLANQLKEQYPDYSVYHSDDYVKYGYAESLYVMMDDIAKDPNPKQIIEGMQAARLLRKGIERGNFHADVVIEVQTTNEEAERRYQERNNLLMKTNSYPYQMVKSMSKVFADYLGAVERKPRFVTWITPVK